MICPNRALLTLLMILLNKGIDIYSNKYDLANQFSGVSGNKDLYIICFY